MNKSKENETRESNVNEQTRETQPTKIFDDEKVEELVQNVKAGNHEKFNELLKIYRPWINRSIRRISGNMLNAHREDIMSSAQTALYEAIIRFDCRRHKSAFHYLGNSIRDELRLQARKDNDGGVRGLPLSHSRENEDGEFFDVLEQSQNSIYENLSLNPEEHAIKREFYDRLNEYRKTLREQAGKHRSGLNRFKVFEDMCRHPGDSIREIADRTKLSKSAVNEHKDGIIQDLWEISRTTDL